MIGLAHPEPAPASGHELVVGATGGGGGYVETAHDDGGVYWFWDAGGGLSYAARIGSLGLGMTAWSVVSNSEIALLGGHVELAIPVGALSSGTKKPYESGEGRRVYILAGAGYGGVLSEQWHRPQGSIGVLLAPQRGRSGGFSGARLHGGVQLDTGSDPHNPAAAFTLTGAFGYRWSFASRAVYPNVQFAPFLDVVTGDWRIVQFGAQLLVGLGFQLG